MTKRFWLGAILAICIGAATGCGKKGDKEGGGGGAGDPELVKAAEELATAGCACPDTKCLYGIKSSDGRGVAKVMRAKTNKLTAEQKKAFYVQTNRYNECEGKLSGAGAPQ